MTKTRSPFLTLAALLVGAALVAAPARAADKKKADDTPLAKAMEDLGDAVKALKKSVKDPTKKEESLKLVSKAQHASLVSKDYPPAMLAKAPEADRPKIMDGYRKAMAVVIADLCKLEQQIIDGKTEEATETMKNLKVLEDDGHEKYNP